MLLFVLTSIQVGSSDWTKKSGFLKILSQIKPYFLWNLLVWFWFLAHTVVWVIWLRNSSCDVRQMESRCILMAPRPGHHNG